MDRFEADLMDDLMSDAAEGPAARHGHAYDEFDEFDEGDEFDGADAGDDEFLGQLLGGIGRVAGGLLGFGAGALTIITGYHYDATLFGYLNRSNQLVLTIGPASAALGKGSSDGGTSSAQASDLRASS